MKRVISRLSGLIFLMATVLVISCLGTPAGAIQISSTSLNIVTKSVNCNESVCFSSSDFADIITGTNEISLSSLPDESLGVLMIGDKNAEIGSSLSPSELETLSFRAGPEAGLAAMFEVTAVSEDGSEKNVAVVVRVKEGINYAPIAENIELDTYKGASAGGIFRSFDTEGDKVTYTLKTQPRNGEVTVNGQNFIYTPADGKKGRDTFSYTATDSNGNESEEAEVLVRIYNPKTEVTYSDMEGNRAYYASLCLAENNILIGENVAGNYFFSPSSNVSRGEFLAMCMRACNIESREGITSTDFSDDAFIDLWLKPYVSTALTQNIVGGYKDEKGSMLFSANAPITYAEAAVTLNNILKVSDAEKNAFVPRASVPSWAYQAEVNLASIGIMPSDTSVMAGGSLTRADAAEMISSVLKFVDERDGSSLLRWFR